jgi:hypothetical protein
MAETNELGIGFDRRSLIKRGLVAGGIAAAAPVISTFNVPAFAASPGTFGIFWFLPPGNSTAVRTAPTGEFAVGDAPNCYPAGWTHNDPGTVALPIIETTDAGNFIFTLSPGDAADCDFTAIGLETGGLTPGCSVPSGNTLPSDSVHAPRNLLILVPRGFYVTIVCV